MKTSLVHHKAEQRKKCLLVEIHFESANCPCLLRVMTRTVVTLRCVGHRGTWFLSCVNNVDMVAVCYRNVFMLLYCLRKKLHIHVHKSPTRGMNPEDWPVHIIRVCIGEKQPLFIHN